MRAPAIGAMLVVATAACGGLLGTNDAPDTPVADASSLEASPDSTLESPDGDDATAADASLEASPSPDASANDAGDAGDSLAESSTSDAAEEPLACDDDCTLGEQECSPLPQVCTYDDAGFTIGCEPQAMGIWTCVGADAGCTTWARGVACKPDVPCCVTCEQGVCPRGSEGEPCEQDTDCASDACDAVTHECVSSQCADHRQDGQESGVDCGGPVCNACQGGQGCRSSFDCRAGQYCLTSHVCSGPPESTADASARDAAEEPSPCDDECAVDDYECSSLPQVCTYDDAGFTVSCEAPGEGVWACVVGSAGCAVWVPGAACGSAVSCCAGCEQVACDAGTDSLCWSCPPGSDGKPCEEDTDCVSGACDAVSHVCVSSQCADHRLDGLETDVDCGGPDCNECQAGQRCQSNRDCQPAHICEGTNGYWNFCL